MLWLFGRSFGGKCIQKAHRRGLREGYHCHIVTAASNLDGRGVEVAKVVVVWCRVCCPCFRDERGRGIVEGRLEDCQLARKRFVNRA